MVLTTLYSFCSQGGNNCPDGSSLYGSVVQGSDRNFYETTFAGGVNSCNVFGIQGCGTVFQIAPGGSLTTLHKFNGTDGEFLVSQLTQDTNGSFYGAAAGGGNNAYPFGGCGTLYGLGVGLHRFIETVPAGGNAGDTIQIQGDGLTRPPPALAPGAAPQFAYMTPWVIQSPSQFRPAGPPAMTSARYASDFSEVKSMSSATS